MTHVNGYLIAHTEADRWLWQHMTEADPDLAVLQDSCEQDVTGAGSLLPDLFCALFKAKPALEPPQTENQAERENLLRELMASQEYRELRVTTRLRPFESAEAVKALAEPLLEAWRDWRKHSESKPPVAPQDALAAKLRGSLRLAHAAVLEQQAFVQAWDTDPGSESRLDLLEAQRLAKQVGASPLMRRLALLAGRFKSLALRQHAVRVRRGCDELADVELGCDLARVLPCELISLRNPRLRPLFFARYVERKLLQYRLTGRETLGQGPVVVCLDSSGSMDQDGREAWAKAVALALLTVARRERRDFALVHFGSASECEVFRFKRGIGDRQSVVNALGFAFHGGTDFERPLREAIAMIQLSRHQRADVVFLTDGCAQVGDDLLHDLKQIKKATQLRIFSVLIDPTGSLDDATLQRFSNEVLRLRDLTDDQAALQELFGRN